MKPLGLALVLLVVPLLGHAHAQSDAVRAPGVDFRVAELERRLAAADGAGLWIFLVVGLCMFLCGCFCALWAQNTRRGAWTWFTFGFFLGPLACFTLLARNAADRDLEQRLVKYESGE